MNMFGLVYLMIGFFATCMGALVGIGGGVVIKPALDFLGHYNISTINILTSATVLSMAVVAIMQHVFKGLKFEKKITLFLSVGSFIGGVAGKLLFEKFVQLFDNSISTAIQALILALILFLIFLLAIRHIREGESYQNVFSILLCGILLGLIASFLGVGGGPVNVAILILFFRMNPKKSAVHSILIIIFSQSSKLLLIAFDGGFSQYNLEMLYFMIPGGILGGIIGTGLHNKISIEWTRKIYLASLIGIVIFNIIIVAKYLF